MSEDELERARDAINASFSVKQGFAGPNAREALAPDLPPERTIARLRYLNTPTSNWAAECVEALTAISEGVYGNDASLARVVAAKALAGDKEPFAWS